MDKWYKEPLLHFLVLGAILFFLTYKKELNLTSREIIVTSEKLKQLNLKLKENKKGEPTKKELDEELAYYLEDEMLYQEALRLGLDKDEPLIKKILVDKMKYTASDGVVLDGISDKELRHYFELHKEEFVLPTVKISFSHIYFSPTKDANYTEHADKLFSQINSQPYSSEIGNRGNTFYGGKDFNFVTKKELRKYFSRTFIDEIFYLDVKKWSSPINSEFGRHIIYIHQREENREVSYKDVKKRVKDAWLIDANTNAYKRLCQQLRKKYNVIIKTASDKE